MNDGTIGLTGNLKINRKEAGDHIHYGIGVGYTFTEERTIRGLSLTRGQTADRRNPYDGGEADVSEYPQFDRDNYEWISVFIKNEDSGTWEKIEASEYIECVTDNHDNSFVFYPAYYSTSSSGKRKPGYGIWNHYFSNGGSEITTSYLVLKYPVDCEGVMIVDHSGNDYIDVAEMGIYEEDPLKLFAYENFPEEVQPTEIAGITLGDDCSGDINESILINGAPATEYTVTGSGEIQPRFEIGLVKYISQSNGCFVFWRKKEGSDRWTEDKSFGYTVVYGSEDDELFTPWDDVEMNNPTVETGLSEIFDTPFMGITKEFDGDDFEIVNVLYAGNPLAYVPEGIDSPRTFAYKMYEQREAWNETVPASRRRQTLLAESIQSFESYKDGYTDERGSDAGSKPFLPGYYLLNGTGGYDDPGKAYALLPEKVAGVDSIGMVQGALSMMDQFALKNVTGEDLISPLDTYYHMSSADAPGLDAAGKPLYGRDGENSYDGIPRLSVLDIEKNTIIVPDVRLAREGDLLVRTGEDGELHLGVIVGFKDKPDESASLEEWMANILVVSTRAGFRMANLGVWGNSNNLFGGFSEEPESYMIRRWLLPEVSLVETGVEEKDTNEVIETLHYQRYSHYVEEGLVPWESRTSSILYKRNYFFTEDDQLNDFASDNYATLKRLPYTSYASNILSNSLFKDAKGDYIQIRATCYTGWRDLENITYHRGFDCNPPTTPAETTDGHTEVAFYSPEDGKFMIIDLGTNDGVERPYDDRKYIKIDGENVLFIEGYYWRSFGDVGVLVTRPDNPRDGRIYVFAHLWDNECPDNNDVQEGDSLGKIGGAGDKNGQEAGQPLFDPHIHIEVYEYFPEYRTETYWGAENGSVNIRDILITSQVKPPMI